MIKYWLIPALLLTIIFALPMFVIRAQPFDDRVMRVLTEENCTTPCFIGIRPGITTMSAAVYDLDAHEWIASKVGNFPSQVQQAIYFDAGVPRITMHWRWSEAVPGWINASQPGSLTVEDRGVKDVMIDTYISLGELFLAYGEPDEATFIPSNSGLKRFEYTAWYADESILIQTEGLCPLWRYYDFPARIMFRTSPPRNLPVAANELLCK
jgi:hypothetical protein